MMMRANILRGNKKRSLDLAFDLTHRIDVCADREAEDMRCFEVPGVTCARRQSESGEEQ